VRQARSPAHTPGERVWLTVYAVASTAYRIFISVAILLFVSSRLPFIGALLAVAAVVAWVLVPLGKFVHYLASNSELARVRPRAVFSTAAVVVAAVAALGLVPAPDRCYVEGVVEPARIAIVHAGADGFLESYLPSGRTVSADGAPLVTSANPVLEAEARQWQAERRTLVLRQSLGRSKGDMASVQILDEQIGAVDDKIRRAEEQLADLAVRAPFAGTWLSPEIDVRRGAYLKRGEPVGLAVTLGQVLVRAVAGQDVADLLMSEAERRVEIRVDGRPDAHLAGTIKQFLAAGQDRLPSPALSHLGGGAIPPSVDDPKGLKAAERVFEVQVLPDPESPVRLLAGQRVVIRFETRRKPLLEQWKRSLLQLIQRRYKV
jgi:putative peptide zinc metalloprotease protein